MLVLDTFPCTTPMVPFIVLLLRVKWYLIPHTGVCLLCIELQYVLCLNVFFC
jgi:hypothetical protein